MLPRPKTLLQRHLRVCLGGHRPGVIDPSAIVSVSQCALAKHYSLVTAPVLWHSLLHLMPSSIFGGIEAGLALTGH